MVGVVGLNHKTAELKIRETFYIAEDEIVPLSELILQQTAISEIVILSTCNRTEIYFYSRGLRDRYIKEKLVDAICEFKKSTRIPYDIFYLHTQKEAVKHLFEVSSGIDSLVIGENQIVNQIKEFYLKSTKAALTGAMLMRLFQKSFETSKRVRTETNIQKGATSISYVAVDWCHRKLKDLSDKTVMMVGAGETGRITLEHFSDKGTKSFYLTNRTFETAEKLAESFNGKALPFNNFKDHLPACDIVITASNANDYLITKNDVGKYINGHPALFVDLSVPRNIDDSIKELKNAEVVAVDDLSASVENANQMRTESIEMAQGILEETADEYMLWFEQRRLRPVITAITKNLKEIHRNELANSEKFHSEKELELMGEFGQRLTQKYTRHFVKQLKLMSGKSIDEKAIELILELFETED